MSAPNRSLLLLYQYAAGLCDSITGMLLVFAPSWTLHRMGLTEIPRPIAFVRYLGVFVLSVGLSYLWAAIRWPLTTHAHIGWSTQWKITAMIRTLVALFIVWQVAIAGIEVKWIIVAFSDSTYAIVQWIGLRKGWLERAG